MTALLEPIRLLASLGPDERRQLASSCRHEVYDRGAVVFCEGERGVEISFVAIGAVKIVKATPTRSVILRIVGVGEPIGIVAVYGARPYPGTAIALVPTTILRVPEREFLSLVDRHPEMLRQLLRLMMDRQVLLGRRVAELTGAVESRLARVLLELLDQTGRRDGPSGEIGVPLTRQDLADLAATTVETTIRIMSRWGKEGLVRTVETGFAVPDVEALRRHLER